MFSQATHLCRSTWHCALTHSFFDALPSVDFVKWSSQGMLRMSPDAMNALFKPTIDSIIEHLSEYRSGLSPRWDRVGIGTVLTQPSPVGNLDLEATRLDGVLSSLKILLS